MHGNKNSYYIEQLIILIIMSTTELPLLEPQMHEYKVSRRQSVLSNYDPSAYPPNLQFARQHGLAQRIGEYIPPREDIQRCPCCLQPIYKPELKLGCQLRQLLHIGSAYPLYFHFIKQCIVLMAVNIVICCLPSLIINLTQGNMCSKLDTQINAFYSLICKSSVINIMNITEIDMLEVQAIFNLAAIFISIAVIGFIDLDMTRHYNKYYNDYNILPRASDYSVIVKGLPKDITISEIQQFISNRIKETGSPDCSVLKIYLIYNLKTYYALYTNKRAMVQQITALYKKLQTINQNINTLYLGNKTISYRTKLNNQKQETLERISQSQNKKQLIQIQINNYEQLFKLVINRIQNEQPIDPSVQSFPKDGGTNQINNQNKTDMRLKFSGKCIVTLNSIESKQALTQQTRSLYLLQKLGHQLGECLDGVNSPIVILDAPEPSQIIFSNIGSEKLKRWTESICVTVLLVLLIGFDFVLLTIQKKLIKQQKSINSSNILLSFINSQLIALFNSIVSRVIRISQNKTQMHSTQSSYYYSVTSKLVFLYLINMLVTTFFSNMANYYLIKEKTSTFDKFPLNFQEYLFDIFFLLVTNPFTSFFLIFFDHRQGYKYYMRYEIENNKYPATQAQANLYYENMQIDLSNKYSNVYRFVLFTAGVCFIFPPALIITLITLSVFYWEDKYLLLRRYVIAHKLNFRLTEKLQKILWAFPLMMATTNLIIMFVPIQDGKAFQEQKYSKAFYYLSVIALIASAIVFLGGCKWVVILIEKIIYRQQSKMLKQPEYKDIEKDFQEDYWHYYPYFKIKKRDQKNEKASNLSPRKQKMEELNKKMGMDVFSVIKSHLHHDRYSPIV